MRLAGLGQRQLVGDLDAHVAASVGGGHRAQPIGVAGDDEVVDVDPALACLRAAGMLRQRDGADVAAAVAQRAERRHRRRAADDVEDRVDRFAGVERVAVDDLGDAIGAGAVGVLRPHCAHDLRARGRREPDRQRADAAQRAVDQHPLAGRGCSAATACSAVRPASGSDAATPGDAPSGHGPRSSTSSTSRSVYVPRYVRAGSSWR